MAPCFGVKKTNVYRFPSISLAAKPWAWPWEIVVISTVGEQQEQQPRREQMCCLSAAGTAHGSLLPRAA